MYSIIAGGFDVITFFFNPSELKEFKHILLRHMTHLIYLPTRITATTKTYTINNILTNINKDLIIFSVEITVSTLK